MWECPTSSWFHITCLCPFLRNIKIEYSNNFAIPMEKNVAKVDMYLQQVYKRFKIKMAVSGEPIFGM